MLLPTCVRSDALRRRQALAWLASLGLVSHGTMARAQTALLQGREASMVQAVRAFTGGAAIDTSRVKLTVPELVENGNVVPIEVSVDSPMTASDHITHIALFNERNPLSEMVVFELGPANARAWVSTRVRLATTQHVMAVARTHRGTYHAAAAEVIVTLAACIET